MALIALNLLQAIYILSYQDTAQPTSHLSDSSRDANNSTLDVAPHSSTSVIEATPDIKIELAGTDTPDLKESSGIAVLAREVRLVSRSLVNDLVESGKGLNSVRFALWPKGGFLATYVKQASLIAHLGLMKGDVIKSINNTQMSSVLHALSVYQDLDDMHFLELSLERQGKPISYFYKIID